MRGREVLLISLFGLSACGGSDRSEPDVSAGGTPAAGASGAATTGGKGSGGAASGLGGVPGPGGDNAGGASQAAPGDSVFAEERILEFRMRVSAADWEELEAHGDKEEYVPASAIVTGEGFEEVAIAQVGLRHKGAYSLHHCWDEFDGVRSRVDECEKLSYKIRFDEYQADERLDGLKRINLHASAGDTTKLRELLAYDTFRAFGVDAPRARPAKLFINDQFQGLFIAVEDVDGRYTKAHFPAGPNGNLYKEIWPRVGVSEASYVKALETNDEEPDVSDMLQFAEAVAGANQESFDSELQGWVNLDELVRYVAVDRAMKNWDGIMAFYAPTRPHNYYWYHADGSDGRFHLIPWDLDNTFWDFDPYMHPEQWVSADPVPDWNSRPINCEPRSVWELGGSTKVTPPRCDKLLDLLALSHWSDFVTQGRSLLAGPLALEALQARIARWTSELRPIIEADPVLDVAEWQSAVEQFPATLQLARDDFEAYLSQGLIDEAPAIPIDLPEDQLNAPSADSGLHIGGVTNFEFENGATTPAEVLVYSDDGSSAGATWNTRQPISGKADLLFDFTFRRRPGAWNEWADLRLGSQRVADVSGYTRLIVRLASDRARTTRIRVASPAYEDTFGGAWAEFGVEVAVNQEPKLYSIRLATLPYPQWAKDNWQAGQGWETGSEAAARATVLERCSGLTFGALATTDAAGELSNESETGFLRIDDIYFQ